MTTSERFDTNQKLEAVERAIGLCKRVAPSMIARGNVTQGQVSNLLSTLKQVVFDYQSQALQARKGTSGGCSSLLDANCSGNLTTRTVD